MFILFGHLNQQKIDIKDISNLCTCKSCIIYIWANCRALWRACPWGPLLAITSTYIFLPPSLQCAACITPCVLRDTPSCYSQCIVSFVLLVLLVQSCLSHLNQGGLTTAGAEEHGLQKYSKNIEEILSTCSINILKISQRSTQYLRKYSQDVPQ